MNSTNQYEFSVSVDQSKKRLDHFLSTQLSNISRAQLQRYIKEGCIYINGHCQTSQTYKVKEGDKINLNIPDPKETTIEKQNIPLNIVYEDEDLIIIDKPAGMVVHPAAGNYDQTLVNALMHHCGDSLSGIGGELRPGIVHRIDKDTSGLLVAAKNDYTHNHLSKQFKDHSIDRSYKALIWGKLAPLSGTITGAIGRHPQNRKKMAIVAEGKGKQATTHYKTLKLFEKNISLVECTLETGRTHQIRVHLSSKGNPILGDALYGRSEKNKLQNLNKSLLYKPLLPRRQMLHACILGFVHPRNEQKLFFESKLPNDINELIKILNL